MVIHRSAGMASNYDCSSCYCPGDFTYAYFDDYTFNDMSPTISPSQATTTVGYGAGFTLTANFQDCNGYNYNYGVTYESDSPDDYTTWDTDDHSVAIFNSPGDATAVGGGTTTVIASYTGPTDWYFTGVGCTCDNTASDDARATLNADDATMSGAVHTIDGSTTPSFNVTTSGSTPTSYAWSFTAPSGAGDNPNVNFSPNNQSSTTTDAHWFALPDSTCNASASAAYTIIATVTFPGSNQMTPQTTLTVALYSTAGYVTEAFVSGLPSRGQNSQGIWVVTGNGSLSRNVGNPVVVYATTSQFYNKAYAHENKHYQQWTTGMNSDLYVVSNLMTQLSPLTGTTEADLLNQINTSISNWNSNQHSTYVSRLSTAEAEAYQVSDPIAPQYKYQSACGAQGL